MYMVQFAAVLPEKKQKQKQKQKHAMRTIISQNVCKIGEQEDVK